MQARSLHQLCCYKERERIETAETDGNERDGSFTKFQNRAVDEILGNGSRNSTNEEECSFISL